MEVCYGRPVLDHMVETPLVFATTYCASGEYELRERPIIAIQWFPESEMVQYPFYADATPESFEAICNVDPGDFEVVFLGMFCDIPGEISWIREDISQRFNPDDADYFAYLVAPFSWEYEKDAAKKNPIGIAIRVFPTLDENLEKAFLPQLYFDLHALERMRRAVNM